MTPAPKWLEELEAKARAATQGKWVNDEVIGATFGPDGKPITTGGLYCDEESQGNAWHIAANSPAQVLALCKLVRKLGTAIDRYMETGHASVLMRADEAYQRGPVVEEDSE